MNVIELYNKLCEIIPQSLSCEWDRDGLECCPDPYKEVKNVLVALDVTGDVIDEAIGCGADVIISHHPIFFGGLGNLNALNADGVRAVKLVKNSIATMSFHTRLDALHGGVNDILAEQIGLVDVSAVGEEQIMRIGSLPRELDIRDFCRVVKGALSEGEGEGEAHIALCPAHKRAKRVAVLGGSGGDDIALAAANGADTYVTGELKYHQKLSAKDFGINLIEAGHFFTEYPVCAFLERTAKELLPDVEVRVIFSNRITEI